MVVGTLPLDTKSLRRRTPCGAPTRAGHGHRGGGRRPSGAGRRLCAAVLGAGVSILVPWDVALGHARTRSDRHWRHAAQRDVLRQWHRRMQSGIRHSESGRSLARRSADLAQSAATRIRGPNSPWRVTDPHTLEGEAGLYGDDDPNCCPSQQLVFRLRLNGDSLVLLDYALARSDAP